MADCDYVVGRFGENLNIVPFLALGMGMAIALDIAMAMAMAKSS